MSEDLEECIAEARNAKAGAQGKLQRLVWPSTTRQKVKKNHAEELRSSFRCGMGPNRKERHECLNAQSNEKMGNTS